MAGTGLGSKARPRPCRAVGQFVDQSRLVAAAAEQETQYRLPGAGEGQFPGVVCTWRQGNRSCATKQASRASAQDHCGSQTLRGGDSGSDRSSETRRCGSGKDIGKDQTGKLDSIIPVPIPSRAPSTCSLPELSFL